MPQASGGVAPFTWTVSAGALPHNVVLSNSTTNTVTISGTPDTAAQGVGFSVKVTDSASQSASQSYAVSILLEPDTLTLSPASLSFTQVVGTPSGAQAEVVTNAGTPAVAISSIALIGNPAEFGENNTCGSSLAAELSWCSVNITFTPSQLGPMGAALSIIDNTVGSPHNVSLTGLGLTSGANATLSATKLTFGGSQLVGTPSGALSVKPANYGTTALNITSITATTDFGESDNCQGSNLASGANCTKSSKAMMHSSSLAERQKPPCRGN
jgi:putative Ig domain-containing protein